VRGIIAEARPLIAGMQAVLLDVRGGIGLP